MSKLLERLSDPAKSGVYRVAQDHDIRDVASKGSREIVTITLGAAKAGMLESIAAALDFPEWFGGNWDALEDSLTDLSWREHRPLALLFRNATPGDDLGILLDILASSAEYWREREQAFFAIFVDPAGKLALPSLYRERRI